MSTGTGSWRLGMLVALLVVPLAGSVSAQSVGDARTDRGQIDLDGGRVTTPGHVASAEVERQATTSTGSKRSLLRDIGGDFRSFFATGENYTLLGSGLVGALGLRPLDDNIAASGFNAEQAHTEDGSLDRVFEMGDLMGSALLQVGGAFATYGFGAMFGSEGAQSLGRDLVRAQLLTQGVTQVIKHTVRRTRPDQSSRNSFPSGHTSGAFATATILQRRYGWKVGGPAYGIASYVAASRLSENKHFLSDVMFGAAVGFATARTIALTRGATRFELAPMATVGGAGISVAVSRH